jgi:IS30 family transposase
MKNKKRKVVANEGCGHITTTDRQQIDLYLKEGKKFRRIAKLIGKGRNAVTDEVARNSVKGVYDWKKADAKARLRRKQSKYQGMKIVNHDGLWKYVKAKLRLDWSPEQIAGRLKWHEKKLPYVSAKGIYKFIYGKYGYGLEKYLRYRGNGKKPGGHAKAIAIDGRVFIENRPKSVMGRRIFGHWEADFIVSGKNGKGALLVFVERKSRYVLIFKLEDRKAATVNAVLGKLLGVTLVVTSLTIDNDVCFRHHKQMSQIMHAPIFFCHPYHSWEKGSVENMNKWIRQYVKKGSDISKLSDKRVQFVEDRLNGRPREVLKFKMPKEVFQKENNTKKEISGIIKVVEEQKNRVAAVL